MKTVYDIINRTNDRKSRPGRASHNCGLIYLPLCGFLWQQCGAFATVDLKLKKSIRNIFELVFLGYNRAMKTLKMI